MEYTGETGLCQAQSPELAPDGYPAAWDDPPSEDLHGGGVALEISEEYGETCGSALLDTPRISRQGQQDQEDTNKSNFEGHWRQKVANELDYQGYREVDRFRDCGQEGWLDRCHACGKPRYVPKGCDIRICPICARRFAERMSAEILGAWKKIPRKTAWSAKHITLTVKTDGDLRKALDRGYKAVSGLWRTFLKRPGSGMVVSAEFGPENGNLHFHCFYYGPFIAHAELSNRWLELTGDSSVVYVRRVFNYKGVREVLKYACKMLALDPELVVRVHAALKGTRRIRTFGCFYGEVRVKHDGWAKCEFCGNDTWDHWGPCTLERWKEIQAVECCRSP